VSYILSANIARRNLTNQRDLAQQHGLNQSRIAYASPITQHAPELADAVMAGALARGAKAVHEEQDQFRMRDQPVPDRGAIFGEVYDDPPEETDAAALEEGDDEEAADLYTGAYVRQLLAYIGTLEEAILRGNVPRRLAPGMIDQL
jgi:hypothetical protein